MNRLKHNIFIFAILLLLILPSLVFGDSDEESLRGIKGFNVSVEEFDPELERDGLTIGLIQTDIELKLRMAGIKVLPEGELFKEPGMPYLYILVNGKKLINMNEYVYNINVLVYQNALLIRNKEQYSVQTWDTSLIGGSPDIQDIRQSIKDLMDDFLADYLSVNPK
ncbi:hypothetical protein ACFL0M_02040 [Thermodesulfobacteriota bacterium]